MAPAEELEGLTLKNGWFVRKKITKPIGSTGSYFSHGYLVEHESGRKGFLKALDYTKALSDEDPASKLAAMATAYNFEREVCLKCKTNNMDRIVQVLDDGTIRGSDTNPAGVVQYLIFELADDGDIRRALKLAQDLDHGWVLGTLHHVAVGLRQLHNASLSHQDLKPSNVLLFRGQGAKVGDLGQAVSAEGTGPNDRVFVPGDRNYTPIDQLYGYQHSDWKQLRIGADLYHLGSLATFLYSGVNMTKSVHNKLPRELHWHKISATFDEALPHLLHATSSVLDDLQSSLPEEQADELRLLIGYLCHPNPKDRGFPCEVGTQRYSLERFISRFDSMSKRVYRSAYRRPVF